MGSYARTRAQGQQTETEAWCMLGPHWVSWTDPDIQLAYPQSAFILSVNGMVYFAYRAR